jgi:hypothetical protein
MKLRIKGNSLRLRVTPSEMTQLMEAGRIEETIHFAANEEARLTYALEHSADVTGMAVRYAPREMAVVVSSRDARRWSGSQEVGLYGEAHTSAGALELAVEKDFACLDKSEAENADRFPNPKQGSAC